ncbi:hypothetical protein ZIOFF_048160 [Zingiber officinale]|uniref:Uncharacterized protein n=1 Tax=Zingiber officinale TaxID=94328 RepID=A0A8J5FP93_ZINOF|nr:hypothetical protein ZIOFF_048160 [Zingiber officinale]
MSSDFFDIVLPNPVFSVDKAGLGLRRSPASAVTGLWFSETTGKEILLLELEGTTGSDFKFDWTVSAIPCRALPADRGRSGNFVLRFGGTSLGKSGRSIGRTGARGRGLGELGREDVGVNGARGRLGELGREEDAEFTSGRGRGLGELGREEVVEDGMRLILDGSLPTEGERPAAVGADGVAREMGCLVGVDGRELDEDITEADLAFTGVDERVGTERDVSTGVFPEEGVTGRLIGVDGLEVTEAELVFRTEIAAQQIAEKYGVQKSPRESRHQCTNVLTTGVHQLCSLGQRTGSNPHEGRNFVLEICISTCLWVPSMSLIWTWNPKDTCNQLL